MAPLRPAARRPRTLQLLAADGHWGVIAPVFWTLWLGVVALVVFLVVRRRRSYGPSRSSDQDILAERFARGELSQDEYRNRLAVLRQAG